MKEIIVIRTSDPDGSVFQSILEALQGKDVQILHAADLDASAPSTLALGDIEIFPEQRRVTKAGKESSPSFTAWPVTLDVYSVGSSSTMRPGARTMN